MLSGAARHIAAPQIIGYKMGTRTKYRSVLAWVAVAAALSLATTADENAASQRIGDRKDAPAPFLPTRRAPDSPPAAPPALPSVADRVPAVTVSTIVRRTLANRHAETLKSTISRTVDRVHFAEKGREWLFERNIRDPRRVSGFLIEHASRAIVSYEDSDLRMMLGIRGWSDVVALGFEIDRLSEYTTGKHLRTVGGIQFRNYSAKHSGSARELWWNDEQLLAAEFTMSDATGSTRFSVTGIHNGVDERVLRPPDSRFPAYRVFNLADWLERH